MWSDLTYLLFIHIPQTKYTNSFSCFRFHNMKSSPSWAGRKPHPMYRAFRLNASLDQGFVKTSHIYWYKFGCNFSTQPHRVVVRINLKIFYRRVRMWPRIARPSGGRVGGGSGCRLWHGRLAVRTDKLRPSFLVSSVIIPRGWDHEVLTAGSGVPHRIQSAVYRCTRHTGRPKLFPLV